MCTLHALRVKINHVSGGKYNVGEVYCDLYHNGKPQPAAPRNVARAQFDELQELGYTLKSSVEYEYVVRKNGKLITEGLDAFTSVNINPIEELLYDIASELEKMNVFVEGIHTEYGPGQIEMTLVPSFSLAAIDKMYLMKDSIKQMFRLKGFEASFMTMSGFEMGGASGAHFNHSLWNLDGNQNAMYNPDKPEGSEVMKYWVAGLLKHAKALTALCCPTVNCYRFKFKFKLLCLY